MTPEQEKILAKHSDAAMISTAERLRTLSAVKNLLPKSATSTRRSATITPPSTTARRSATIAGPAQTQQQGTAQPPQDIPVASMIGQGIPIATPIATPVAQHAPQQPIAGPSASASHQLGSIGPPQFSSGGGGGGIAGSSSLLGQSAGIINSGGSGNGGSQDLLSAITQLTEAIKDLIEKMGEQNTRPEARNHTVTHRSSTGTHRQSGPDPISRLASGAPGIEWANTVERWFMARFGRR